MSKERWLEHRQLMLERVFDEGKWCVGCVYNEITKDPFSTGDSPDIRECLGEDPELCLGVEEEWIDGMFE